MSVLLRRCLAVVSSLGGRWFVARFGFYVDRLRVDWRAGTVLAGHEEHVRRDASRGWRQPAPFDRPGHEQPSVGIGSRCSGDLRGPIEFDHHRDDGWVREQWPDDPDSSRRRNHGRQHWNHDYWLDSRAADRQVWSSDARCSRLRPSIRQIRSLAVLGTGRDGHRDGVFRIGGHEGRLRDDQGHPGFRAVVPSIPGGQLSGGSQMCPGRLLC
jgi:hypothetical protein